MAHNVRYGGRRIKFTLRENRARERVCRKKPLRRAARIGIDSRLFGHRVRAIAIPGGRTVRVPLALTPAFALHTLEFAGAASQSPGVSPCLHFAVFRGLGSVIVVENLVAT